MGARVPPLGLHLLAIVALQALLLPYSAGSWADPWPLSPGSLLSAKAVPGTPPKWHTDAPCLWGSSHTRLLAGRKDSLFAPEEAHHLNPEVSASWHPPQRPSPQETKQTLSPEFPCFFSSKFPIAAKLQLRGRLKGTQLPLGLPGPSRALAFLTLCFLWPAARLCSSGCSGIRRVSCGETSGSAEELCPPHQILIAPPRATQLTKPTSVRWKAEGNPKMEGIGGTSWHNSRLPSATVLPSRL